MTAVEAEKQELQKRWDGLLERVVAWVEAIGGWGMIRQADIARVVLLNSPQVWNGNIVNGQAAMSVFLKRTVAPTYPVNAATLDAVEKLTKLIENADDPRALFFEQLREAAGIGIAPITPGQDWPFTIELIPLDKLYADETYQRPLDEAFVRELVLKFDERLVGTLDVAEVDGRYAIMDGQQRWAACGSVGKTGIHCAVYLGLTTPEQARFFHHKNRDRKAIHPYYHFRARLIGGDTQAELVNEIVERHGYKFGTGATQDDVITAVRACEEVFGWSSESRDNSLDPTLEKMHRLWFGVKGGKDGNLIRGLGRFFAVYSDEEMDWPHLEEQLAALGPSIIMGRAKDVNRQLRSSTWSIGMAIAQALVTYHNTGLPRDQRLSSDRLFLASPRATATLGYRESKKI